MAITLRVGNTSIGLVGLEATVSRLKKMAEEERITPGEAARQLLEAAHEKNYIPTGARERYLAALETFWKRQISEQTGPEEEDNRQIRILGPGCVSCNRLEEMVLSILSEHGVPADIEHVKDLDEIWRYGVIQTPALVIGKKVLCSGRLPTRAAVEGWLREFVLP